MLRIPLHLGYLIHPTVFESPNEGARAERRDMLHENFMTQYIAKMAFLGLYTFGASLTIEAR